MSTVSGRSGLGRGMTVNCGSTTIEFSSSNCCRLSLTSKPPSMPIANLVILGLVSSNSFCVTYGLGNYRSIVNECTEGSKTYFTYNSFDMQKDCISCLFVVKFNEIATKAEESVETNIESIRRILESVGRDKFWMRVGFREFVVNVMQLPEYQTRRRTRLCISCRWGPGFGSYAYKA